MKTELLMFHIAIKPRKHSTSSIADKRAIHKDEHNWVVITTGIASSVLHSFRSVSSVFTHDSFLKEICL